MRLPQIGERWKHFKGTVYWIVGFDHGAEGDELVMRVKYCIKDADGNNLTVFSRPLSNFLEPVDTRADARFTFHSES